jgi:MYXO-CTERM domain-containing protein
MKGRTMNMKLSQAAVACATLLFSTTALAQGRPHVLRLTDGNNAGPRGENDGPGAEQASVTKLTHNGDTYVQIVWMSSQVSNGDRPYQCKCTSIKMDPLTGPTVVAESNAIQITANDGDRPCNHPKTAALGGDKSLLVYGTNDPNQANVQTYAEVLNYNCTKATSERLRISNNNNTNEGAPDVVVNGMRGGEWVATAGYLSANNNGESRAVGLNIAVNGVQATITKTFDRNIVAPANIGRPSIQPVSTDRSLFCSSKGNNRPPEEGVACALINTTDGTSVWRGQPNADGRGAVIIAASQPNNTPRIYMNQPQVTVGENGRYYLQIERSTGAGRNNNNQRQGRGSTTTLVYALEVDDTGPSIRATEESVGQNQVHGTICSGAYGADGALHSAVFDASITGTGPAAVQMVRFDVTGRAIQRIGRTAALGAYNGDGGMLANLYGNNPNTQGRDFMRCIGDVPNPGFGNAAGFRPDVRTFFVFPYSGQVPGEDKLSLFASFFPGFTPPAPPPVLHGLTVRVTGEGRVDSSPLGIDNCTAASCTSTYEQGTAITLTAVAAAGNTFVGWTGSCTGAATCVVRMDRAHDVTATFTKVGNPLPTQVALSVALSGEGSGVVSSAPAGITCSNGTCTANFDRDAQVSLTAAANEGSEFAGWMGACSGTAACAVTLDVAKSVTAVFNKKATVPGPTASPNPGQTPAPSPGVTDPGTDPKVSACSTTGDSSGALVPSLIVLGLALIVRRRRS